MVARHDLGAKMTAIGLPPLGGDDFHGALESVIQSHCTQITIAHINWPRYLSMFHCIPSIASHFISLHKIYAPETTIKLEIDPNNIVIDLLQKSLGHGIENDQPLHEAGIDSLFAMEFANLLADEFPAISIPKTLIFDYPTVNAIVDLLMENGMKKHDSADIKVSRPDEPIAIIGLSCRFPGGAYPQAFWDSLCASKFSVTEVPLSQWDVNDYYDADSGAEGKTYARHGGFIVGAELFDADIFNITAAEANAMDPQQRLLLEVAYDAFHQSGYDKDALDGSAIGVFVGQAWNDWSCMQAARGAHGAYNVSGSCPSISAGRISYTLGLKGPSLTVNTACSSSLVALDLAVEKLRRGKCDMALSAGVNLLLSPNPFITCAAARMLSRDGVCVGPLTRARTVMCVVRDAELWCSNAWWTRKILMIPSWP
eukprot:GEMP01014597.1.p1 GENE.GEMP01014597.1~~GEMP01014597.1.p1  ORF type:complete len:426 (+),score=47.23 GEMP01014597.1:605-1882(+)